MNKMLHVQKTLKEKTVVAKYDINNKEQTHNADTDNKA